MTILVSDEAMLWPTGPKGKAERESLIIKVLVSICGDLLTAETAQSNVHSTSTVSISQFFINKNDDSVNRGDRFLRDKITL